VPAFTQVDVGARYRVQIAGKSTLVRVQMTNITDGYGWDIVSSRSFQYKAGRAFNAYVAMDF